MKKVRMILIVTAGILGLACTTRVSEWVLLNIIPHRYTLVYFHNDPPTPTVNRENAALLENIKSANIDFRTVKKPDTGMPYYGLYYEGRLFSKFHTAGELADLTRSPLREKIAGELTNGKLCVMVYLTTGLPEKDDAGFLLLQKTLEASPFGKIIPVFELNRQNKEEALFTSLLLNVEDDLQGIDQPMLFGVFGRFKALEPLVGRGITEENIGLMIDYFTAECSCLIKDNLPGTDILFTEDWDNPQPALLNGIIDANLLSGK